MSKRSFENYNEEKPWLEIIRYKKKKVITPTERIREELEEIIALRGEIIKSSEADKIIPKLREMIADEESGIAEYEELLKLFKRISIATGELEIESRTLEEIIKDEKKHKKDLEYILKDLTR